MTRRVARVLACPAVGLASVVLAGCVSVPGALDAPGPVILRVDATASAVTIDAPDWYATTTALYLCTDEPPALPEPGPERDDWTPGAACHAFGEAAAPSGLATTLDLTTLDSSASAAFAAADDWYLLLVDVEGGRAAAAVRSRFARPDGFGDG